MTSVRSSVTRQTDAGLTPSSTRWKWRRTVRQLPKLLQGLTALLPDAVGAPLSKKSGIDRLAALVSAIDIVRRGGTISVFGVYGGAADPLPVVTMFDKQLQLRMGQANVLWWVDDIMPLLVDEDPLGVDTFATHHLPLAEAPHAYEVFQKKEDGAVNIVLHP